MKLPGLSRRSLLVVAAATLCGAVGAEGARWLVTRRRHGQTVNDKTFRTQADAIRALHRQQTADTVKELKTRYEGAVFGKVRVWDLIEKLGQCVDPTDSTLLCTSQLVHVQQVLAGMRNDGIDDPDLHLAALLHDLGKVLMLAGAPADVVCGNTGPIGKAQSGVGLDQMVFQFGHPEFIYSRMKDHVPDHVAWLLRYHGVQLTGKEPFLDERDRRYVERYYLPFHKYDLGTKSAAMLPRTEWPRWRALIEERFPEPILV
jgi:hypothetical protein